MGGRLFYDYILILLSYLSYKKIITKTQSLYFKNVFLIWLPWTNLGNFEQKRKQIRNTTLIKFCDYELIILVIVNFSESSQRLLKMHKKSNGMII